MDKKVFLDYAATTPIRGEVAEVILNEYKQIDSAEIVKQKIKRAKSQIATLIGCECDSIYITNSGSEGNNAIIKTVVNLLPQTKRHIITSEIEHPSVLNVFKQLERNGFEVSYLKVDSNGIIILDEFYEQVSDRTGFVSIMFYNNEIGTRQPIEQMGAYLQERNIFFHVDGVQAVYNEVFRVSELPIDAMSFSAHKLYGPKGIGGLYIKHQDKLKEALAQTAFPYNGYAQEGMFSENMPYLVGFDRACELALGDRLAHIEHLRDLKRHFTESLVSSNTGIKINAHNAHNHPGIINIMLPKLDADIAVINLDMNGFAVSTGSACSSGAVSASHVLMALGYAEKEAKRCIRISLGRYTTKKNIDDFFEAIKGLI